MNNQQRINFDEAREVLGALATYIAKKIQSKNAAAIQTDEINLASQPEIKSDHLGEEAPLSSLPNELIQNENNAFESAKNMDTPYTLQMESPAPVDPVNQSVEAGMGVSLETSQPVSPIIENPVPANPINQNVEAGMGVSLENGQPVSQVEVPSVSGLESVPSIDLPGLTNQPESQNGDTAVETFAPEAPSASVEEGYKAINNTSTIGYTSDPQPAAAPVVMPTGTTQDMAIGESVVVGPEAFNMTR